MENSDKEKYVFQIVRVFTWRENLGFETHEERHYTDMICDTEKTAQDMTEDIKKELLETFNLNVTWGCCGGCI